MKKFHIWILAASFFWGLLGNGLVQAQDQKFRILFTSFDPFDGRPTNNTQPIAEYLGQNPGLVGEDIEVQICNLPVVYDRAAVVAGNCIENLRPDLVISLGEGGCDLRIETAATNRDDSFSRDNLGQTRSGSPIVPGAPLRLGFAFPVHAMFCALDKSSPPVAVSVSAGGFVCNNTAYRLARDLALRRIPFTFIHVPRADCSDKQGPPDPRSIVDPKMSAQVIGRMVGAAVLNLLEPPDPDSPWPHPAGSRVMPSTRAEAQSVLERLKKSGPRECELSFAEKLLAAYGK